MKKLLKIVALVLLIVFVGMQFIPTKINQGAIDIPSDFIMVNQVPEAIQQKLKVSCYDCHSNNTRYTWYNKIQPVALFLEDHIMEGKAELNFSEWADYSDRRKRNKLTSIISQIKDDEMPLSTYTIMHRDAKFSEAEKAMILEWLEQLKEDL